MAKGVALSDETVRQIVDRCEGVPLVLEEVTRSALEATTGATRPPPPLVRTGDLPAPLQLVVQSRLDRWPQFMPIVQSASVLGREFSVQVARKDDKPAQSEVDRGDRRADPRGSVRQVGSRTRAIARGSSM